MAKHLQMSKLTTVTNIQHQINFPPFPKMGHFRSPSNSVTNSTEKTYIIVIGVCMGRAEWAKEHHNISKNTSKLLMYVSCLRWYF